MKDGSLWKKVIREVKVAQLCLSLCDSMDCTVHGILQARILEWVAFLFSRDLSDPGIELGSLALQETLVRSLEEGMATHSSILAWRIPWTVQSMGSQRVRHD